MKRVRMCVSACARVGIKASKRETSCQGWSEYQRIGQPLSLALAYNNPNNVDIVRGGVCKVEIKGKQTAIQRIVQP
jgi:hypothetical protein